MHLCNGPSHGERRFAIARGWATSFCIGIRAQFEDWNPDPLARFRILALKRLHALPLLFLGNFFEPCVQAVPPHPKQARKLYALDVIAAA